MTEIKDEIRSRLHAGEPLHAVAEALGLDVIDDDLGEPMVALPGWVATLDGAAVHYPDAADADEAAIAYVDDGDWGSDRSRTGWVTVHVYRVGYGADGSESCTASERCTIELEPIEPECTEGDDHDWAAPHDGVRSSGGGVVIHEVCLRCGCGKITDTWAQNPETGEQGLRSVEYREGEYGPARKSGERVRR